MEELKEKKLAWEDQFRKSYFKNISDEHIKELVEIQGLHQFIGKIKNIEKNEIIKNDYSNFSNEQLKELSEIYKGSEIENSFSSIHSILLRLDRYAPNSIKDFVELSKTYKENIKDFKRHVSNAAYNHEEKIGEIIYTIKNKGAYYKDEKSRKDCGMLTARILGDVASVDSGNLEKILDILNPSK